VGKGDRGDQRKIIRAPAGCGLMGSAKNTEHTAPVRGKHNRSGVNDNTRQLTLMARQWGGLNALDDTG
jgi:hypothetical protein